MISLSRWRDLGDAFCLSIGHSEAETLGRKMLHQQAKDHLLLVEVLLRDGFRASSSTLPCNLKGRPLPDHV